MKKIHTWLVVLLAALLLGSFAVSVAAEGYTLDDDLQWRIDEEGTLIISGKGPMWQTPWLERSAEIREILIEEGCTSICSGAFQNLPQLKSVELPDSLRSIGENAFGNLPWLTKIYIPAGVESIHTDAFTGCQKLQKFDVSPENSRYSSDNQGVLLSKDRTVVISCPMDYQGSYIMPNQAIRVEEYAFEYRAGLTHVELSSKLEEIGAYAFFGCDGLKEIEFPKNLVKIQNHAFSCCSGLEELCIPGNVKFIEYQAFENCSSLRSVIMEDGTLSIGYAAFSTCRALQRVVLPGTITRVESGTFSCCSGLPSIVIPDRVTLVDSDAFFCCGALQKVKFEGDAPLINYAFTNDRLIIYYPAQNPTWTEEVRNKPMGVNCVITWKPYDMMLEPDAGEPVPPKVMDGGTEEDFDGNVLQWTLYDDGTLDIVCNGMITEEPWRDYEAVISHVNIYPGCTGIDDYLFNNYTNMSTVNLPDSLQSLGVGVFSGCTVLRLLDIPKGVSQIDDLAFRKCYNLTALNVSPDNQYFATVDGLLLSKDLTQLVFVPSGIQGTVRVPDTVKTVATRAFYMCTRMTGVSLPKSVEEIGWESFMYCEALKEVTIPGGVKQVPHSAFKYCIALESLTLEEGVEQIAESAFESCEFLRELNLPDSLRRIEERAFYDCDGISFVLFPKGIQELGFWSFHKCDNLRTLAFLGNAPKIGHGPFETRLWTVYYPGEDSSWTEEFRGSNVSYSSMVTWIPFGFREAENGKVLEIGPGEHTDGVFWSLKNGNTLHISGTGTVDRGSYVAWDLLADSIEKVVVEEGITTLGTKLFSAYPALEEVELPESLTLVDNFAFEKCANLKKITFHGSLPILSFYCFDEVTADVYYPQGDASWEKGISESCGGNLTLKGSQSGQPEDPTPPDDPVEPGLMWGDANEDKVIDFKDAIDVLEHYVETELLSPEVQAVCDLYEDGTVDFKDAIWILEIYVETRPDPNMK